MFEIEYLTDKNGQPKAVVIPIEVWQRIFTAESISETELSEGLEDYCLNKAMDEAKDSPLLDRKAALEFLEEQLEG
ncbi:MAG: hypothetical protein QNJ70_03540 [Xenococcaceae cyanobacterium MO_207.B15]|nr:hypothetical protein [Xenococcaceae cyanobacterium MO_207.B15]MDJ0747593.1 hypothetical protein [Xenococcaceae cyanobacterium MO_167.B27]